MGRLKITTSDQNRNNWRRFLPGIVISGIAIIIIVRQVDWQKFLDAFQYANYALIALSIGIAILWLVVRSFVWRTILKEKATLSQVFMTMNEGYLINNILPFRAGEFARALLLSEKANLQFWYVFSTVVIERLLDVAMTLGVLLITLPFVIGRDWEIEAVIGVALVAAAILVSILIILYLIARNRQWALDKFEKAAIRWPILSRIGRTHLESFFSGLAVMTETKRFLRVIALMMLNWAIAIIQYYVLVLAFIPIGTILWGAFSLGMVSMGMSIPSSPGSLGVFELSLIFALSVFGVSESIALAMAITARALNLLVVGSIGAFALAKDGETLTGLYNRARSFSQKEVSSS